MSVTTRGGNIFLGVETMVPRLDEDGEYIYTVNALGERLRTYEMRTIDTPLDRVTWVSDDHIMSHQLQGILDGVADARDISLIGRYVQAVTFDERGNASGFVEGKVEFVRFVEGQAVLMVNNQEIFSHEIMSVSDGPMVIGRNIRAQFFVQGEVMMQNVEGVIQGIGVNNNRAYVVLRTADGVENLPVDSINHLVEGLQFVGRNVTHPLHDFNGRVSGVILRNRAVYMYINNNPDTRQSLVNFRDGGSISSVQVQPDSPTDPDDD
jgi:hypothetical protein